jgi:hypothetical protein
LERVESQESRVESQNAGRADRGVRAAGDACRASVSDTRNRSFGETAATWGGGLNHSAAAVELNGRAGGDDGACRRRGEKRCEWCVVRCWDVAIPYDVVGGRCEPGLMEDLIFACRAVARADIAPIMFNEEFFEGVFGRQRKGCGYAGGEAVPLRIAKSQAYGPP